MNTWISHSKKIVTIEDYIVKNYTIARVQFQFDSLVTGLKLLMLFRNFIGVT